MANLNAWMVTGRVKSMEEIKGGLECVAVDIECAPFERYDEEVFTFSFNFFGEDKERLMATVAPGDTIMVSGKIITDPRGCLVIMNDSWRMVGKANHEAIIDPSKKAAKRRKLKEDGRA